MKQQQACILGGTGFVGQHLIPRLTQAGYRCVIPSRRPHRHRDLKLVPNVALRPVAALDQTTLEACFDGCDCVVNLVGILHETPRTSFQAVHVDLVERVLAAAHATGVTRLLHMSALPADAQGGSSAYLRSKGAGEDLAHAQAAAPGDGGQVGGGRAPIGVTSFRPSLIFGRGDSLFNRFATLIEFAPGVLPLACPDARFAPVWVGDVVAAMVRSLERPETVGRRLDLCGPQVLTLEDLVTYTARQRRRWLLLAGLNDRFSRLQGQLFEHLPGKPFTLDNYLSLQTPSVCGEHNGLLELGIHPSAVETIVPGYLQAA